MDPRFSFAGRPSRGKRRASAVGCRFTDYTFIDYDSVRLVELRMGDNALVLCTELQQRHSNTVF